MSADTEVAVFPRLGKLSVAFAARRRIGLLWVIEMGGLYFQMASYYVASRSSIVDTGIVVCRIY